MGEMRTYVFGLYEFVVCVEEKIRLFPSPIYDIGHLTVAFGLLTFSREHLLLPLRRLQELPLCSSLAHDLADNHHRMIRNAFAHGYWLPQYKDNQLETFIFFTSQTDDAGNILKDLPRIRHEVSSDMLTMSIRLHMTLIFHVFSLVIASVLFPKETSS